jgi:hypothetical protein
VDSILATRLVVPLLRREGPSEVQIPRVTERLRETVQVARRFGNNSVSLKETDGTSRRLIVSC